MKVFFHYISEYVPKCWNINDDNEKVLEAINIALKLKNDFSIYPYYFYFTNDEGQKIEETKYYINGQILNSRDIRTIDRQLYNYTITNKWDKMIKLAPEGQVVLYEPFFENIDANISI
jgi:hypothetical protein